MVNLTHMKIKNSNLNGGDWVNLNGVSFQPAYNKITNSKPTVGQTTTNYLISKGDNKGIENPVFNVKGVIDIDELTDSAALWNNSPGANATVTLGYLISLYSDATGTTYIQVPIGSPDDQKYWPNYDLTSNEIKVIVKNQTPVPDEISEGLHFINFSITLEEVR